MSNIVDQPAEPRVQSQKRLSGLFNYPQAMICHQSQEQ